MYTFSTCVPCGEKFAPNSKNGIVCRVHVYLYVGVCYACSENSVRLTALDEALQMVHDQVRLQLLTFHLHSVIQTSRIPGQLFQAYWHIQHTVQFICTVYIQGDFRCIHVFVGSC